MTDATPADVELDRLVGELMRVHSGRHEIYREPNAATKLVALGLLDEMESLTKEGEEVCSTILAAAQKLLPKGAQLRLL